MNFDFTGHAEATLKDTVNLAVKQLEESDIPRLYFPCKRVGDEVNELQYHYFGRYYEEDEIVTSRKGNTISAGATFSMKNLTEKPENWDETWGAFYIDEKDNTGFKIYIVVPHVGVTDYTISYIEYSIVNRVFKYTRNFKELKRSYKNIQEAFSEVSYALKIKNILFVLSPRATPMFYYDMYTTMATMNKEVASYIGRFLERLLQYSWIEVLYKSGLPRTTVKEYMSDFSYNERNYLDTSQTSARMMMGLPKPLWKMALRGELDAKQLQSFSREAKNYKEYVENVKRGEFSEYFHMDSFDYWLESRLPEVKAFDWEDIDREVRRRLERGTNGSDYYSMIREYREENSRIMTDNIKAMSPKVKDYYQRLYEKEVQVKSAKAKEVALLRIRIYERGYKLFMQVMDITKSLNKEYGVNHTARVVNGEGGWLIWKKEDTSAIAIHLKRGFDLKRVVGYIYYQCPLDQGFNLRGTKSYSSHAFSDTGNTTYRDYLDMISRYSTTYDKYPRYLKTAHDIAVANVNLTKDSDFVAKLESQTAKISDYESVKIRGAKYKIIVPRTVDDFLSEGSDMGNCVASYAHSVVSGAKQVIFMRDIAKPNKALINIEIRNGAIVQAEQRFNQAVDENHKQFIDAFAEKVGLGNNVWGR